MFEIEITSESRYLTDKSKIVADLSRLLAEEGIKSAVSVSVLICGRRKVRELARRYLRAPEDHNVLSFPYNEVDKPFVDYPDGIMRLGDIVVCFPIAQEQAIEENKMVDEVISELAQHGLMHLLGKHHEE